MERMAETLPRTLGERVAPTRGATNLHFPAKCSKVVPTTTKGNDMSDIRLTTRGKIVLAVALVATFWALVAVVTPDECEVPADQMSRGCISLVYGK